MGLRSIISTIKGGICGNYKDNFINNISNQLDSTKSLPRIKHRKLYDNNYVQCNLHESLESTLDNNNLRTGISKNIKRSQSLRINKETKSSNKKSSDMSNAAKKQEQESPNKNTLSSKLNDQNTKIAFFAEDEDQSELCYQYKNYNNICFLDFKYNPMKLKKNCKQILKILEFYKIEIINIKLSDLNQENTRVSILDIIKKTPTIENIVITIIPLEVRCSDANANIEKAFNTLCNELLKVKGNHCKVLRINSENNAMNREVGKLVLNSICSTLKSSKCEINKIYISNFNTIEETISNCNSLSKKFELTIDSSDENPSSSLCITVNRNSSSKWRDNVVYNNNEDSLESDSLIGIVEDFIYPN